MAAMNAVLPNKDAQRATALKLYTGEVIRAFKEKNIGLGLIKSREISGGKTAQFIVTGAANIDDVKEHTRGAEVESVLLSNDEVTISIDKRYYHSHFLDTLDEKIAQYDIRSELATQSAEVLATKIDKDIFKLIGNTVPAMAPKPGQQAATTLTISNYDAKTVEEKGNALIEKLFEAKANLNKKNVTETPSVIVAPETFYAIVQSTRGTNNDYTSNNGGIDTGAVRQIAGFGIGWTNHLDTTTNPNLLALVFTKDVAGVVKAMDIQSEANYDFRRLGWQLTSFYAMGMGPLNPTGMVVINKA